MQLPAFIGGSFESLASTVESEHTINFYVESMESEGSTSKKILLPTPGVSQLVEHGSGLVGRGHYFLNGREFAVIGSDFVEIDENGTVTDRGDVAVNANPATIVGNGDAGGQILITSGGTAYVFTLATNAFAAVGSPPWSTATMCGMLDGYGLILDSDDSRLWVSALQDFSSWSASQFAERNLAADRWVSMKVLGRYIYLLGQQTSEVWYNVGSASSFPFAPYATGLMQAGISAPFSATVVGETLCWLSQTKDGGPKVVSTSGFSPEKLSSTALESDLGRYANLTDAIGDTYTDLGHTFYLLTFIEDDITWAYDMSSQTWAQRGTWVSADNEFTAWAPRYHAYAFGQHRMLDAGSGKVFRLGIEYPNDANGSPVVRLRRAPVLEYENKRVYYSSFELDLEPGLGLSSGQGSDPQVMMRFSNDGGKTWSAETMRSAGAQGQYGKRVRWTRCGMGRRRVFEVRFSDPIPWRISNAYIEAIPEGGRR